MTKLRRIRWAGHVARTGERWIYTGFWWERQKGARPLGTNRRRWKNNIRMYVGETRFSSIDWIHLAPDRDQGRALVNTATNLRVP
jgi:hypothetical protein